MPVIPIAALAVSAYGAVSAADAQRKAINQANDAAKAGAPGQVNIQNVAQQAHDQAIQNAYDSAALEKQLNPLAPQLRTQSLQALMASLKEDPNNKAIQKSLIDQFNSQGVSAPAFTDYGQSELSQQSQAEALRQLQLGGKLDQETANQVMRSSAAHAGQFGGGLGLGRDISARDLGLTSLGLQQQRLATAGQFGASQDAFNAQHSGAVNAYGLNAAQLALQQQQQRAALGFGLQGLGQNNFNNALAAAQFGQSIAQPVTGLDPSAIANLAVGNSNQQGAAAQNAAAIQAQGAAGKAQLAGQIGGAGLSYLQNYYNQPKYGVTSYTPNGGVKTYGTIGYNPPPTNYSGSMGMFGIND